MSKINYIKTTLFDSTVAHFKLTIESRLTRVRQTDGSLESLCYLDQKGNLNLNPNIYLVFTYRGETFEETKSIYMSYPQLYKIRNTFECVKNLLLSEDTFTETEGVLEVTPQYKTPIVLTDIGKDKKWISFGLVAITNDEGSEREKGVAIQISGNDLTSVLSFDEFMTIYTIVGDLNLISLQTQFGLFSVFNDNMAPNYQSANYYPQQQAYAPRAPRPNYSGYPSQQNNYGGVYAPQQAPQAPRYNSQPRTSRSVVENNVPATYATATNRKPTAQETNGTLMQPRTQTTPIINMAAIEETPVDSTNWDDEDAIDGFFNDNN